MQLLYFQRRTLRNASRSLPETRFGCDINDHRYDYILRSGVNRVRAARGRSPRKPPFFRLIKLNLLNCLNFGSKFPTNSKLSLFHLKISEQKSVFLVGSRMPPMRKFRWGRGGPPLPHPTIYATDFTEGPDPSLAMICLFSKVLFQVSRS